MELYCHLMAIIPAWATQSIVLADSALLYGLITGDPIENWEEPDGGPASTSVRT